MSSERQSMASYAAKTTAKAAAKSLHHNLYRTTVPTSLVAHTATGLAFSALAPMTVAAVPAAIVAAPVVLAGAAVMALFAFASSRSSR